MGEVSPSAPPASKSAPIRQNSTKTTSSDCSSPTNTDSSKGDNAKRKSLTVVKAVSNEVYETPAVVVEQIEDETTEETEASAQNEEEEQTADYDSHPAFERKKKLTKQEGRDEDDQNNEKTIKYVPRARSPVPTRAYSPRRSQGTTTLIIFLLTMKK